MTLDRDDDKPDRSNPDSHEDVTAGLESDTAFDDARASPDARLPFESDRRDDLHGRARQWSVVEDENGLNTLGAEDADAGHGFQTVGEPEDFELRRAEAARYDDMEIAPALALEPEEDAADAATVAMSPARLPMFQQADSPRRLEDPDDSDEPVRPMRGPLAAALILGLAARFCRRLCARRPIWDAGRRHLRRTQPRWLLQRRRSRAIPRCLPDVNLPNRLSATPIRSRQFPLRAPAPRRVQAAPPPGRPRGMRKGRPAPPPLRRPRRGDWSSAPRRPARACPSMARSRDRRRRRSGVWRPGRYQVRITRDGYVAEERRLAITTAQPSPSVSVVLKRTAPVPSPAASAAVGTSVGTLTVLSRPDGAQVFLDDRLVGTTPLTMPQIGAGQHAVRLEREGYRSWSSSIRMVGGQSQRVAASLER